MPLEVPADVVLSVPAKGEVDAVAQDAGFFIYASGPHVYAADEQHGTTTLFTADPGFQLMGVDADLGFYGLTHAWAEGSYADHTGRTPCSDTGAVTWRLFVDSGSGAKSIASGANTRVRGCTAAKPLFALYGDSIAYAEEAPRAGHPQAWRIKVVNIFSGDTMREIDTDEDVFSLDLSNADVAYAEGTLDPNVDPNHEFNTRLMLAAADASAPRQIATDAFDVSFDHERLAWIDDQGTSQRSDSAPGPQAMTATLSDLTPLWLAGLDGLPPGRPESAEDTITWVDDGAIVLASPNDGILWRVSGTGHAEAASARYDDLAWVTLHDDGSESLDSYPLPKLLPPLPTPSTTPSPTPALTSSPSSTPAPPESIVVDGITWQRLDAASLPPVDYLVPSTGLGRVLAVGGSHLFSSPDGISWTVLGQMPDGSRGSIFETASSRLLTGGSSGEWYSDDGATWTFDGGNWGPLAAQCEGSNPGIEVMYDATPGLLGFGSGFWRSDDGSSWQCVGPRQDISSVAFGNGTFVGSGSARPGSEAGMLFASSDAVMWHQTQPTSKYLAPVSVADGFVALNEDFRNGDQPDILYTSSDGKTWHRQPNPFGQESLWPLTSDGSRAVVLGTSELPGDVWVSSTDGTHWTRYELPPRDSDRADSVAIVGDLVVVSGTRYNGDVDPSTPVVWVAQIP